MKFEGLRRGEESIDRPDRVSASGDRLEQIIEAANHVAAKIRDDAEAQARRYVEDARNRAEALTSERIRFISEASDSLLEQGRMMKAQTEQLVEALRDAAARIATATSDVESQSDPVPRPAPPERSQPDRAGESLAANVDAPTPRDPAPAAAIGAADAGPPDPVPGAAEVSPEPPPPAPRIERPPSEERRLLATRMAVAGSNPSQVEARLREVGVEDPVGLVDAVFNDV